MKSCCQYHSINCKQGRSCPARQELAKDLIAVVFAAAAVFVPFALWYMGAV